MARAPEPEAEAEQDTVTGTPAETPKRAPRARKPKAAATDSE